MAAAGGHDGGAGGFFYDSDFMVLRPDKGGLRDHVHLLWSPKVVENAAVDCPARTEIAKARRRWAVFVSLVAQMLLLWAKRPVVLLGRVAEYWMNFLNENGGSVFKLLANALHGRTGAEKKPPCIQLSIRTTPDGSPRNRKPRILRVRVAGMAGAMQSVHALGTLPPDFVRPEEHEPPREIPVIDMYSPYASRSMADAAQEWGIFQAVNHGVPAEAVSELQRVGCEFFALPQAEKQRYAMDPASLKTEGYGSNLQRDGPDGKKTWADFLFHNVAPPSAVNRSVWPENPVGYRAANEAYCSHMLRLTRTLFEGLSAGLGLEEGAMAEAFGGEDVVLLQKINHYPPCPQPELAFGVAPHTDLSALTVLVPNEVAGLQVFRDGQWHDVEYVPGALIVHIGDQIEIMSNGRYKAVLHRTTVSKEKTRMSWPVFVEPPTELVVGPHPRLVTEEIPAKYKAKKFKDYKYCKINKLPQ